MECLIGIKFNDFVLIAADMTNAHSILVMKSGNIVNLMLCTFPTVLTLFISDYEKLYKLADNLVMAVSGESGDTIQYAEYIAKNIQLYKMRNQYELSANEAAVFTRRNLAEALRTGVSYLDLCCGFLHEC